MIHSQNYVSNIRFFTALISLLLSGLAFYSNDILNSDGILYMEMSRVYLESGLNATAKLYNWPFFSIFIAHIHQVTSLSFEHSVYLLNTILFVLLTDTLVLLSNKILPNGKQLAFAALLFLCFQTLNEYRDFIIRDTGYWAFCSMALYRFILFLDSPTLKNATLWQLVTITAVLFRIEGVVILLALPLYLFITQPSKLAIKQNIQLYYFVIIGILLSVLFAVGQSDIPTAFKKISSITTYIDIERLSSEFNGRIEILGHQILNKHSEDYSGLILISGMVIMLIYKLMKAISIGYIGLYIYSQRLNITQHKSSYRNLFGYFLALNVLILIAFMFIQYFVSKRYTIMALVSILLLMLPALSAIIERAWSSKNKTILTVAGLILLINLVDGTTKSNSKLYIKDVAIWASHSLPKNSHVLTDDKYIQYYFNSHQPVARLTASNINSYQDYDYLIVVEKRKNTSLKTRLSAMNLEPIFTIENKRGDKATTYAVKAIE